MDDKHGPQGIVFDFVNILRDKYGFNYTVKIPKQNIIGDADTGIISMVYKNVSTTTGGSILGDSSLWGVTSYRLVNNYGSLEGAYHLHLNLLKPAGHVMHQQFNIQQLYVLSTLYLYVLYLSENKQRLVPLTAQTDRFL